MYVTWSLFDLLKKNKGLYKTTLVVMCLVLKLFSRLNKLKAKEMDKNWNSCPPLNHKITFCLLRKLYKYQNNFFGHQILYKTKVVQYLTLYPVLFYLVPFYTLLTFCISKDPWNKINCS
jgi:hypothetical protein